MNPTIENCMTFLAGIDSKVNNAWNISYEENCRMESLVYSVMNAFPIPTKKSFDYFEKSKELFARAFAIQQKEYEKYEREGNIEGMLKSNIDSSFVRQNLGKIHAIQGEADKGYLLFILCIRWLIFYSAKGNMRRHASFWKNALNR